MFRRSLPAGAGLAVCLVIATPPQTMAQSTTGAQLFDGMGSYSHPIRTSSPDAQRYFDQGLALLYNFNHAEAERSFLKAPAPDATLPLVSAIDHFARATALSRSNRAAEAAQRGEQFESVRAKVSADTIFVSLNPATAVLDLASSVLKAELASDAAAGAAAAGGGGQTGRSPV
jgi:hypothetical protein